MSKATAPVATVVMAAPPTPNGDLHLGHLAGPYSGADIFARAQRLLGRETLYVVGSDIHQSYVPWKAREVGADALTLAKKFDDEISDLFARMRFSNAGFVRPRESALHAAMVAEFLETLCRNGAVVARAEDCLFCADCDRYLFEAHVTGVCPHCGNDDCDANVCEVCAWPNVGVDLIAPRCNHCGRPAGLRSHTRLVFPLSQYADRLRAYHRTVVMSPQLEALAASIIEAGLPDIAVTHPTDWGLPAPVPGFEDQRVYVWVETAPGHMAALAEALSDRGEDPAGWRRVWDQADVAQFFGWDNGYFYALLLPALMMAYDPTLRLPAALCANEFLLLDDAKFSTSRGHAIWGGDLLAATPADAVRFALACDRPQFSRTAFTLARFRGLVDDELVGRWQRGVAGLLDAVDRHCGGRIPDSVAATGSQRRFVAGLSALAEACLAAYAIEQFDPRTAVRMIVELVRRTGDFDDGQSRLRATRPDSAETRAGIAAQAQAVKLLAQLVAPIMPDFAQSVWTALGCEGAPRWDDHASLRPGQRIGSHRSFLEPLPEDLAARLGR